MAAIITDQIRILNAGNFIAGVSNASNSYYSFIGLTNPEDYQSDWDNDPPSPKDNFDQENVFIDVHVQHFQKQSCKRSFLCYNRFCACYKRVEKFD